MLLNLSKNLQPPVSFDVHIIALGDGEQLCWVAGNLRRLKGLGGLGWYDLGTGAYVFPSLDFIGRNRIFFALFLSPKVTRKIQKRIILLGSLF